MSLFSLRQSLLTVAAVAAGLFLSPSHLHANDVNVTGNVGTGGKAGTDGWVVDLFPWINGGTGGPGSPGESATATTVSSDASNNTVANGGNGGNGGAGGTGYPFGGQAGNAAVGGAATATATGSGLIGGSAGVSAIANGGAGGSGGPGGLGAGTGGSGGDGAPGADASATATGASTVLGSASATAIAIGGTGGNGGRGDLGDRAFPGSPEPIGSGADGSASFGGNSFASASAFNATADPVTVTVISHAGNGGAAGSPPSFYHISDATSNAFGGSGGTASLGTVFGSSTGGGDVIVTANLIGGDGGYGFLGGAGASESLINGISGSTSGNLTLIQNVYAGNGNVSGDAGLYGYRGGAAGNALSSLTVAQNGVLSLNISCMAIAGNAGSMSDAAGGTGTATVNVIGDGNINAIAGASGGGGAYFYPDWSGPNQFDPPVVGGPGGFATATAIATSTGTTAGLSAVTATATSNGYLMDNMFHGPGSGGAPYGVYFGPGLIGSGSGNAGGTATAIASATNAGPDPVSATSSAIAGDGGPGQGDGFSASNGANATSSATGLSSGGAPVTTSANAFAGNGGHGFQNAPSGNGGDATATASATSDNPIAASATASASAGNGTNGGDVYAPSLGGTATATASANGVTVIKVAGPQDAIGGFAHVSVTWAADPLSSNAVAHIGVDDGNTPNINNDAVTVVGTPAFIPGVFGTGSFTVGDGTIPTFLQIKPNVGVNKQGQFVINPQAVLDVTNNDLIIGNATLTTINTEILNGFGAGPGGAQITSSTATGGAPTFLIPLDAAAFGISSWDNVPITDPNTIIVKYATFGDATLDGLVNSDDFGVVISNLGTTTVGIVNIEQSWIHGDVNLDGLVNADDFGVIISNLGSTPLAGATGNTSSFNVPEPASLSTLALGAAVLVAKKRRRS